MGRIKLLFGLSIFLIQFTQVFAQRPEIGLNVGASSYMGEFNPDKVFKPSGVNLGFFARLNIDPHWSIGAHFNYGKIQGDDKDFPSGSFFVPERDPPSNPKYQDIVINRGGLNFNTNLYEASGIVQFNFFDMYSPGKKKIWTPFIFAGLGGLMFKPSIMDNGVKTDAESDVVTRYMLDEYKNFKNLAIVIPMGAGIKLKQTEAITWQASLGYRHMRNEYLDVYSDKLSYATGSGPNESRKRDAYLFVNIGISYTFVSPKCFTF